MAPTATGGLDVQVRGSAPWLTIRREARRNALTDEVLAAAFREQRAPDRRRR